MTKITLMFDNIVALLGMPRSGTTIISRLVANHSRVERIIEPYQTRRNFDYREIDPNKLCADFSIAEQASKSLLVKETFTRPVNIERLGALLDSSSQKGYRGAHIVVLRSPLEAFLSQVDAAADLWSKKSDFTRSAEWLVKFCTTFTKSMLFYSEFALRFHRRFVIFDRFVANPAHEIGRATGLFGYALEPTQMDLSRPDRSLGGDPKARTAFPTTIAEGDHFRSEEVTRLSADFASVPEFGLMERVHHYIKGISTTQPASEEIVRDLLLLVRRGRL